MSSKVERLRAELALAEAEEAFVAAKAAHRKAEDAFIEGRVEKRPKGRGLMEAVSLAKADLAKSGPDPTEYLAAKEALRELRQEYREKHRRAPSGKGAAAPSPASVEGKVT